MTEIVEVDPDFLFDHIAGLRHVVARYEPRRGTDSSYPVLACGHDLYEAQPWAKADVNWCVGDVTLEHDPDLRPHGAHDQLADCPTCFAEPT